MNKLARDEKGYALIVVLILLLLGSLLIPPLLGYMTTGLKTGLVYEKKTNELYAADAGIEAGLWRIKYDCWGPDYDAYDFDTAWPYQTETVNGMAADVTIQNVWIPMVPNPYASTAEARAAIEKLEVVGTASAIPGNPYSIMIDFTPDAGDNLTVKSLGVWLPQGFDYVADSCSLQFDGSSEEYYPDNIDVADAPGGRTVVWSYNPDYPLFTDFPPEATPMTITFTFEYTPPAGHPDQLPVAIAWITTGMTIGEFGFTNPNNVPVSWDVDTRFYEIVSEAGDTSVQAFSSKCELRQMGDAMSGDYVAIGNSLMTDDNLDNRRETWHASSYTTVSSIPADADVIAAYLYWSGWLNDVFSDTCSNQNFNNFWKNAGDWAYHALSGSYRGQHTGVDSLRYLTMSSSYDLSSYTPGVVAVSWDQWVSGTLGPSDGLDFALYNGTRWSENIHAFQGPSNPPGSYSYTITDPQYLTSNFKIRFQLVDFSSPKYLYIDNIKITRPSDPDTSITFKINDHQYSLDAGGNPQEGGQLTAGSAQAFRNPWDGGYAGFSYASKRDVTKLLRAYSNVGENENRTGNGKYTVGEVQADTDHDLSYAGWSLIVVYSSPATAGHYLYLRDVFAFNPGTVTGVNLDFDGDGDPGGDITNFVIPDPIKNKDGVITEAVAAKLTCFVGEGDEWRTGGEYVRITGQKSGKEKYLSNDKSPWNNVWNGKSPGMSIDGVDIDTFEVLWSEGILMPKDNKLHLDMYSGGYYGDAYNLVYLILSVRSETVTGGTAYYVIVGG